MKIGLLTWYDVTNYGSFFQAYALQEYIESLGHKCVILQHDRVIPNSQLNQFKITSAQDIFKWLRNQTPNRRQNRNEELQKQKNFKNFRKNFLNETAKYDIEEDLDIVIIGSDQIFDVKYFFYDFQFGYRAKCNNISAYAPSFGETNWDFIAQHPKYEVIAEGLLKMNIISARDQNTKLILQNILKRDVPTVLDPTLLYSFKKEREIWKNRLVKEPYLLIYTWGGLTTGEEFRDQVVDFAKRNKLDLISIGDQRNWCTKSFASATPQEFFELFASASMVITNMFHGTCFSILNNKPFYSFSMSHNKHKVAGLLNELSLSSQILTHTNELGGKTVPVIDYENINWIIDSYRQKSIDVINSMIQ